MIIDFTITPIFLRMPEMTCLISSGSVRGPDCGDVLVGGGTAITGGPLFSNGIPHVLQICAAGFFGVPQLLQMFCDFINFGEYFLGFAQYLSVLKYYGDIIRRCRYYATTNLCSR